MNETQLLTKYPIISDQIEKDELLLILQELRRVLEKQTTGDVVEFGCYAGTTSLFIQRMLAGKKTFHVYDSFNGLPAKSDADQSPVGEQFKEGGLAISKNQFIQNFIKANVQLPIIHKSWFKDLRDNDVPSQIAFAFLDADYYESIMGPLKLIWDRLSVGAVVIVDDYQNEALPGASKAVNEWLKRNPAKLRVQASLAVITKQS